MVDWDAILPYYKAHKYFLAYAPEYKEVEVTMEEFVKAERDNNINHSVGKGREDIPASYGFGNGKNLIGRVKETPQVQIEREKSYQKIKLIENENS